MSLLLYIDVLLDFGESPFLLHLLLVKLVVSSLNNRYFSASLSQLLEDTDSIDYSDGLPLLLCSSRVSFPRCSRQLLPRPILVTHPLLRFSVMVLPVTAQIIKLQSKLQKQFKSLTDGGLGSRASNLPRTARD